MKTLDLVTIVSCFALLTIAKAEAAGFQLRMIPQVNGEPISIGIWYPSPDPVMLRRGLGFEAAIDGAISGDGLPLVIISHGNGGGATGHHDTALALAEAGFVVAAPTHPGDNYQDQSLVGGARWFTDRPRHIRRVIDYMLTTWPEHVRLDPRRVGFFGFSMGGYTGLALLGATPDANRIRLFCNQQPDAFVCRLLRQTNNEVLEKSHELDSMGLQDDRIKSAVLAAPGYPYAFVPESLSRIAVPIQLWSAARDDRVPSEDVSELRRLLPVPPEYHSVQGAEHFAFLPPCSGSLDICRDAPGFDRASFHAEFNRAVVDFFVDRLRSR
jgi:predicted dienelactone hydrolase